MLNSVFSMIGLLIIPVGIFIYTINFGRWMQGRKEIMGAFTAYSLGVVSLGITGFVLWRIIA